VFNDGRVYRLRSKGTPHSPFNAAGEPAVLGAGGLAFEVSRALPDVAADL